MGMLDGGTIEVVEASTGDVEALTAISRAVTRADPTDRPEVPAIALDEIGAIHFRFPADKPARTWVARDGVAGDPIGFVVVRTPMAANQTHLEVQVEVVPERRRQGVGSALLRDALSSVDPSRTTVAAHAEASALPWCDALGLASRLVVRESRLDLTECDLDLVRSWLDPSAAVRAGYRLVSWRGPTPDEHLASVCTALDSMADAPMDELDFEYAVATPALVQEGEAATSARLEQFSSLVLAPDGSPAGYTDLGVSWFRPVLGDQGDTVVVAAHRGHRLGRWIKAANLLAAMAVHPELRFVNTYNAESNPWMLSINEDMVFRPFRMVHTVQGPTAAVLDAVGRRLAG